ncbi:MAG: RNA pyrophosphohydrolase, partial [Solimonas sp.]
MTTGHGTSYRRNVGLMLIGPGRRIFVGRRRSAQPEAWQMPQGGVDKDEAPVEAACRELWEEVGTTKALLLRESATWLTYEVPEAMRPARWKGRWHGQAQKWFALAFTGRDADIDIDAHDREFDAWCWLGPQE